MTADYLLHTSKADIITIGCESQLQRRNTLKGLALQKLVRFIMGNNDEDISVKRIFEQLLDKQTEYFVVGIPFKTQEKGYYRKWRFVHSEDLPDYLEIWVREQSIDKSWKICNFCGQKIKAKEQYSRKCWKCKKGWFQSQSNTKDTWVMKNKGAKQRVLDFMLSEGYLIRVQLRKRLDFFHYSQGVFSIYEAKNKEETGLTFGDLRKTLIYPFIVSRCGYSVEKLIIIYNGKQKANLRKELRRGYADDFPFQVELLPIKRFLMKRSIDIQGILVRKIDDKYDYKIVPGRSKTLIIDLTAVEEI
ncbi:MAG: hypothetical protein ACTSSK_02500 [Candidatus Heimdallarchaeota archaeon]